MENIKKLFKQNYKYILLLLLFAFLFVEFVDSFYENELHIIDGFIYKYVSFIICAPLTFFFKFITQFGGAYILFFILLASFAFLKDKKYGIWLTINLGLVSLLNLSLKNIFDRPRPENINLITENGYSFPSGHSMASLAFYGFIAYMIYKSNLKNSYKTAICSFLIILIFFIGLSRIYLGVHFASDVLSGFCVSIAYLILFITVYDFFTISKK